MCDAIISRGVRTTLDIDDDVLLAAKDLAKAEGKTAGKLISELARKALQPAKKRGLRRNGFTLMPLKKNGTPITMELVNRLRDEEE
jgi:hypothetical protein